MLFDERTSGRPGRLGWLAAAVVAAVIVPGWTVGLEGGAGEKKPVDKAVTTTAGSESGSVAGGSDVELLSKSVVDKLHDIRGNRDEALKKWRAAKDANDESAASKHQEEYLKYRAQLEQFYRDVFKTTAIGVDETGGSVAQESGTQIQFQGGGKETENSLVRKWAEDKAYPAKPPVEGAITAVQDEYVELSIGSKDGIHVGQELMVVIPNTGTAKARVVVVKVRDAEALGLVARRYRKDPIEAKDPVVAVGEVISATAIQFLKGGLSRGVGVNSDVGVTGTIAGKGSGNTIGIDFDSAGTRSVRGTTGSGNVVAGESVGAGGNKAAGSLSRSAENYEYSADDPRGTIAAQIDLPQGKLTVWLMSKGAEPIITLEKDGQRQTIQLGDPRAKRGQGETGIAESTVAERGVNFLNERGASNVGGGPSTELLKLDLELAELNVEQKQADMNRVRKLAEQKAISMEEVQQAEFALRRAEIELRRCKALLEQASAPRQR